MKKLSVILFFLVCLFPAYSQEQMPDYRTMVFTFFAKYDYERDYEKDLNFARKKEGWYVQLINRYEKDMMVEEVLFWSNQLQQYIVLEDLFETASDPSTSEEKATKYFEEVNGSYEMYTYERCRYYGYESWALDMINDFRNEKNKNDTLLEGLARAYSNYAGRYRYDLNMMSPVEDDTLTKPTGVPDLPSRNRMEKFVQYVDSSIALYKELYNRNPGYRTRVGNAKMKLNNEQFHIYQQLMMAGYDKEAIDYMKKIEPDPLTRQLGYNYLNSCPPNSILITYGDNDTYPLWYVQVKEGFRKDVAVINNSLLGVPAYVEMLKRNKTVSFSSKAAYYGSTSFDYSSYRKLPAITDTAPLTLQQFIQLIQTKKYPYGRQAGETGASYPKKEITWKLDPLKMKTKALASIPGLGTKIDIELSNTLFANDFMILDIANTNIYTRPLLFTTTIPLFADKYQIREGYCYRLLPADIKQKSATAAFTLKKAIAYITNYYRPVFTQTVNNVPFYADVNNQGHDELYGHVIAYYLDNKNIPAAKKWAVDYFASFGKHPIPPSYNKIDMARLLLRAGFEKEATSMLEEYARFFYSYYRSNSSLELNTTKEGTIYILESITSLLKEYSLESEATNVILEQLKNEEE